MIFLYSRKSQLFLLLLWLAAMAILYAQTTGERPHWLTKASERILHNEQQRVQLGREPVLPATTKPAPVQPARPEADPTLNRCLEWRVKQSADGRTDTLLVELDYVAARENGFSIEKAHGYYLKDAPAYVVAFGGPWTSDIRSSSIPGTIPQVANLNLSVSKSRQLRLIIHTRSMNAARGAKLRVSPTDAGMLAEIRLPRQEPSKLKEF